MTKWKIRRIQPRPIGIYSRKCIHGLDVQRVFQGEIGRLGKIHGEKAAAAPGLHRDDFTRDLPQECNRRSTHPDVRCYNGMIDLDAGTTREPGTTTSST